VGEVNVNVAPGYVIMPAGPTSTTNYSPITYYPGVLTITPALLTVTADDKTKPFGAPLPTLTSTISGFVTGDTIAVVSGSASLSTTATAASPVLLGGYPITAALGTLSAANYTFRFVPGTLTILAFASVRVEVVSVGGIGTFNFTNAVPGGLPIYITLIPGTPVGLTLPTVAGGVYNVTSTTMPIGWYLSSISCTGGGANTGEPDGHDRRGSGRDHRLPLHVHQGDGQCGQRRHGDDRVLAEQ
jgi:hypothetical protein